MPDIAFITGTAGRMRALVAGAGRSISDVAISKPARQVRRSGCRGKGVTIVEMHADNSGIDFCRYSYRDNVSASLLHLTAPALPSPSGDDMIEPTK
jgi:hypothetical protein